MLAEEESCSFEPKPHDPHGPTPQTMKQPFVSLVSHRLGRRVRFVDESMPLYSVLLACHVNSEFLLYGLSNSSRICIYIYIYIMYM